VTAASSTEPRRLRAAQCRCSSFLSGDRMARATICPDDALVARLLMTYRRADPLDSGSASRHLRACVLVSHAAGIHVSTRL
jgi:hypothetical protein